MSKRARKRQKTGSGSGFGTKWDISNFAADMADEGGDGDEFDEEDAFENEGLNDDELARHEREVHKKYDMRRQQTSFGSLIQNLEQKFQNDVAIYDDMQSSIDGRTPMHRSNINTNYNDNYSDIVQPQPRQQIPMEVTLPGVSDPLLWLVPCLIGRERACVLKIMERFFKYAHNPSKKIYITTAFTTDMSTGHIYVEAFKEAHVRRACEDIMGLNTWKIKLVPRNEMVDSLTIKQSAPQVVRGQWCRFKNGLYKGDLGQVYAVIDQGSKCVIKTVPRIDFGRINIKNNSNNNGNNKMMFHKKGSRPTQKYFNYNEMCDLGEKKNIDQYQDKLLKNKLVYKWKNKKFKNGFILLYVPVIKLDFDITAIPSEVEKLTKKSINSSSKSNFSDDDNDIDKSDDDDNSDHDLLNFPPPILQKTCEFIRGDTVKAIKGSLCNLIGEVVSTQTTKDGEITVHVKPEQKELGTQTIPFKANELCKYFKIGCHVKAIRGQYKDETGMIVKVDNKRNEIVLYSDLTSREIRLNMGDITETSEVSTGRDVFGNYALLELVSLSRDCVGVIVDIQNGQFKILDNKGEIQKVRLTDITRHTQDKHAVALDIDNMQIRINDIIIPQLGEFKGTKSTVKHVYRAVLFCHTKSCSVNSGIFVIRSRLSKLAGGRLLNHHNNPLNRNGNESNDKKLRILHHHKARRDPWSNKTVQIKRGPYKGYKGIVKSATDLRLSVELHAKHKFVQVKREHVKVLNKDGTDVTDSQIQYYNNNNNNYRGRNNNNNNNNNDRYNNRRDNRGSRTPTFPTHTPQYNSGGITPGIGVQTPGYATTPSHGSQTPAIGISTPGYNDTPAYGGITPAHGNFTPAHGSGQAWNVGDMTPAHGLSNNHNEDIDLMHNNNHHSSPNNIDSTPMTSHYNDDDYSRTNSDDDTNQSDNNASHNINALIEADPYYFIKNGAIIYYIDPESKNRLKCRVLNDNGDGNVDIVLINDNKQMTVSRDKLKHKEPSNENTPVLIVLGNLKGKKGNLIGIDNSQAILQIPNQEVTIVSNKFVVQIDSI